MPHPLANSGVDKAGVGSEGTTPTRRLRPVPHAALRAARQAASAVTPQDESMSERRRALVIGTAALRAELAAILPAHECSCVEAPLAGVWEVGHNPPDLILVQFRAAQTPNSLFESLRQVAPRARLFAAVDVASEPLVRRLPAGLVDDYVLVPLRALDFQPAVAKRNGPRRIPALPPGSVPAQNIAAELLRAFSETVAQFGQDPANLARPLLTALRKALPASGVRLRFGGVDETDGTMNGAVLEAPLDCHGRRAGTLAAAGVAPGYHALFQGCVQLVATLLARAETALEWRQAAELDDLSGLCNRRSFNRQLQQALERAVKERRELSVLLFDLDEFKSYNDRSGHEVGDRLIREVARLLRRCTRESDCLARHGGDEFAVIFNDTDAPRMPGSRHPGSALPLIERFRTALQSREFQQLFTAGDAALTISGGLATYPWDGKTATELMRAADQALLAAKRTGKNRIQLGQVGER